MKEGSILELLISGYGTEPDASLALFQTKGSLDFPLSEVVMSDFDMVWNDSVLSCSFLCQGDGYVFAVTETAGYANVYSYKQTIDRQYELADHKKYEMVDKKRIEGDGLCHITYSSKDKVLFGACYGSGTIISLRVDDGLFGDVLFNEKQTGADPLSISRAHCVLLNKMEDLLVVANIALDIVYFYEISDGSIISSRAVALPVGSGPRHALFSPDEKYLYIITEYSNEIFIIQNDCEKRVVSKISTLPDHFSGVSYCSTMCFSKNIAFLYAANRGADTITLFEVCEDETLRRVSEYDCGGKYPRHMIVTNDGCELIVCNQSSNNVSVFELDLDRGFIEKKICDIKFKEPACVVDTIG